MMLYCTGYYLNDLILHWLLPAAAADHQEYPAGACRLRAGLFSFRMCFGMHDVQHELDECDAVH
jgi:hypothetical protein